MDANSKPHRADSSPRWLDKLFSVRIFGPVVSTYVRVVQIVCEEAGLSHEVVPTPAHAPSNRHPFGKVPVVEIDGLELYETHSIAAYIDNAHNGGALQPSDPAQRAAMERWISVGNSYLFPLFERGLVMPYIMHRYAKMDLDKARISKALPDIAKTLSFIDLEFQKDGAWTSAGFTLADIFLYCILRGVESTPEGSAGMAQMPVLPLWMASCRARPSIAATAWPDEPVATEG
ncbi:glutathione S-transferase family protein [Pontixanthobacter sp. CEM42]|uniref:glutathione S-transferase family protein n=1 Tax=Pontixanthobacter sp. CEM42 TaxID=2792077 RepID=UPI001AE0C71E|nr:glutathione S-transferase family protein [Pontixanthobacter sp. CEM42]